MSIVTASARIAWPYPNDLRIRYVRAVRIDGSDGSIASLPGNDSTSAVTNGQSYVLEPSVRDQSVSQFLDWLCLRSSESK